MGLALTRLRIMYSQGEGRRAGRSGVAKCSKEFCSARLLLVDTRNNDLVLEAG